MSTPLFRQIYQDSSKFAKDMRPIDNHYHLEMVAENIGQISEFQQQQLKIESEVARESLQELTNLSAAQQDTNAFLSCLSTSIDELNDTASNILDAVQSQTDLIKKGLFEIARRILEQQVILEDIANTLRNPYKTAAQELLLEAARALTRGMVSAGRDQEEEYKDAEQLLLGVLDNPIGRRDYVAWFQLGWLRWKIRNDFADAEEAFYQAMRLSSANKNGYYIRAVAHLAHMQYNQDRIEEAYHTIQKAMQVVSSDHDTYYDAARYAARTSREGEAIRLLDKCIEIQPHTIVTMFSEPDFTS